MNKENDEAFWLAAIIEGSDIGTWLWNVQTGETVFNERWAALIGYTLEELKPISIETWLKYAHPQDLERSEKLLDQHFRGETDFYHCDARMKHKDGHWVWVRDHGKVVTRTAEGEPEWVAGSHIPIHDEIGIQSQVNRLSAIADTIPGMIYEFRQDANGTTSFPFASSGIYSIYGVTPEQVKEDASQAFQVIHPDDLERVAQSIQDSYETLDDWYCQYRVTTNGVERWVTGYAVPQRADDGSVSWFGQIVDTTSEKLVELQLQQSTQNLERAQWIGRLGYWQANMETGELFWSDVIYEIFGVSKDIFTPSVDAFSNFVHPDDIELVRESERKAAITGVHDVVHRIINPDGTIRWVHELADLTLNENQKFFSGTVRDITEQKLYEKELERLSLTDELTGVYNRRYFVEQLKSVLHKVKERGKQACVAIVDIDHFKSINDQYGHAGGDKVLRKLAEFVRQRSRATDTFARLGGEEFGIIMSDCTLDKAVEKLNTIRKEISELSFEHENQRFSISITAGVTAIRPLDKNIDAALKRADDALYEGKTAGRNRVISAVNE
ncbi:hypothetical protein CWE08_07250 [Aliidiomarina iranensis]|uniref:diguanylate cyclase n=1 Tax=Aliidiomarina iranensis TaxID=1434071 RepID=A0A432VWQ5_9GAMM|nr:sensor domain-containing diguanylate cyclase [Aliidiomarina iranensis]RUO20891.1 hypothetical protein CWE08_07250 [Aliidiomarina iranensis]